MTFYITEAKEQIGNITETIGGYLLPAAKRVTEGLANLAYGANTFATKVSSGIGAAKEEFASTGEYVNGVAAFIETVFGVEMPQSFYNAVDSIITYFYTLWTTLSNAVTTVAAPIIDIIKSLFTGLMTHSDQIFNFISSCFTLMADVFNSAWSNIGQPVINLIVWSIGWLRDNFSQYMPMISSFFSDCASMIQQIWVGVLQPALNGIVIFIKNVLAPAFKYVFNNVIGPVVQSTFSYISNLWNNTLKPILQGIITFISGVFSGNWSQAWSGIKSILSGLWNGIKSVLWSPIEWFISKISGIGEKIISPFRNAADSIGSIWSSIKSVFKMPHFTFTGSMNPLKWADEGTPKIGVEWYAKGGIMNNPTLFGINGNNAMIGGEAGPEAIAPIETLMNYIRVAVGESQPSINYDKLIDVILTAINTSNAGNSKIYIDKEQIGRALAATNEKIQGQRVNLTGRGVLV